MRSVYLLMTIALLAFVVVVSCSDGDGPAPGAGGERGETPPRVEHIADGPRSDPGLYPHATYIGREACARCHAKEAELWTGSYHDRAMDHATAATVLGDFNDATFTHHNINSRLFTRDGKYFAHTEGPNGQMTDYEIKFVFGVYPLQQYLVEFPGGRLQTLPLCWDSQRKRWFHIYGDERIGPDDPLFWTKPLQNWNYMCASCHSTDLKKNYDDETRQYKTTWFEIDVSCEACHGPGSEHVKWAEEVAGGVAGGMYYGADTDFRLTNPIKGREPWRQLETCAPCHSRRQVVFPDHRPGKRYFDHFTVQTLDENLYFPDGQMLDEVYVYGSFLQSKMHQKGVQCSHCHDPHSTKLIATGNALCVRCHDAAKYDTADHHHHPIGTLGTQCIECHMPTRTYMQVDVRRDHSFVIPRPDLTATLGTPNACNECHYEEDAQWAADRIVEWYGPKRHNDPHFAPVIAAARKGEPGAIAGLIDLVRNKERPAIIRATALTFLVNPHDEAVRGAVGEALRDDEPLVRRAAVAAALNWPRNLLEQLIVPLLDDPVRAVRIEAARALSRFAGELFADGDRAESERFRRVLDEYRKGQLAEADRGAAHLNLGQIAEAMGDRTEAEARYRKAVAIEPYLSPPYSALATLLFGDARFDEAEKLLLKAIEDAPQSPDPHYDLGRLYGELSSRAQESGRAAESRGYLHKAAAAFAEAAKIAPDNPRFHYNRGVALMRLDEPLDAEKALRRALDLAPQSPEYREGLALLYGRQLQRLAAAENWKAALYYARKLAELYPDEPRLKQQIDFIRQRTQEQ